MPPDAFERGRAAGNAVRYAFSAIGRISGETGKFLKGNKYKALALALTLTPVALEAAGVLSHDVNIEEAYAERLREARNDWNTHHRDSITFAEYLNREGILSPDRIEAIERILAQYDSPVRVRSGFSLVRTLIDKFENFDAGGFYFLRNGQNGREHVLFHQGNIVFNEEFEEFVLSELGHVEQAEKGELNAWQYMIEWIRYFGRRDAMYTTRDNTEGIAHDKYEEIINRDYLMIRDDYRLWARTALVDYLNEREVYMFNPVRHSRELNASVPAFDEQSLPYSEFVRFTARLENASRSHNSYDTIAGAQFFLRILENLPAFRAHEVERPDRSRTLRVIPSQELHQQFIRYLAPYQAPDVPPYEQPRPSEHERETLAEFLRYVDEAQEFDMTIMSTYRYFMITLGTERELQSLYVQPYQGAYQGFISGKEAEFEAGVGARRERGEPIFTFEMYQTLTNRLIEYARTHPTEREQNSSDPF